MSDAKYVVIKKQNHKVSVFSAVPLVFVVAFGTALAQAIGAQLIDLISQGWELLNSNSDAILAPIQEIWSQLQAAFDSITEKPS